MPKRAAIAAAIAVAAGGCGGSTKTVTVTTRAPSVTTSSTRTSASSEILAVPATGASDAITSKIGSGPLRRARVNPGQAVAFRLIPNAAHARQPADPISGHRATTVATTEPLDIHISQATESQSLRLDIKLALTAIGGETGQCALAESRVYARTYFNGPQ